MTAQVPAHRRTDLPDGHNPWPVKEVKFDPLGTYLSDVAAGDESAFADLYDLTAPRVYGLAYAILATSGQAEEVAGSSYLEMWRTSRRFDPQSSTALAWMLAITHRRAISQLRVQRRSQSRSDPTREATSPPINTTCVLISMLTPQQRQSVEMAYYGGLTHSEIDNRTGAPQGTTSSHLRECLAQLCDPVAAIPTDRPGSLHAPSSDDTSTTNYGPDASTTRK